MTTAGSRGARIRPRLSRAWLGQWQGIHRFRQPGLPTGGSVAEHGGQRSTLSFVLSPGLADRPALDLRH